MNGAKEQARSANIAQLAQIRRGGGLEFVDSCAAACGGLSAAVQVVPGLGAFHGQDL